MHIRGGQREWRTGYHPHRTPSHADHSLGLECSCPHRLSWWTPTHPLSPDSKSLPSAACPVPSPWWALKLWTFLHDCICHMALQLYFIDLSPAGLLFHLCCGIYSSYQSLAHHGCFLCQVFAGYIKNDSALAMIFSLDGLSFFPFLTLLFSWSFPLGLLMVSMVTLPCLCFGCGVGSQDPDRTRHNPSGWRQWKCQVIPQTTTKAVSK